MCSRNDLSVFFYTESCFRPGLVPRSKTSSFKVENDLRLTDRRFTARKNYICSYAAITEFKQTCLRKSSRPTCWCGATPCRRSFHPNFLTGWLFYKEKGISKIKCFVSSKVLSLCIQRRYYHCAKIKPYKRKV